MVGLASIMTPAVLVPMLNVKCDGLLVCTAILFGSQRLTVEASLASPFKLRGTTR